MLTASPSPSGGGITNATVTSSHTARSPFWAGATTTPLPSKMSPSMLQDAGYLKQKPTSPRQYCFQGSDLCGALLAVCATALATIPSDNTSDNALHDRTCIFLDCHGALAVCNGLQRCQCVLRQVIRLCVGRIASRLHVVPEGLNCAGNDRPEIGVSPDELGRRGKAQPQQVVEDQHLSIALWPRADADGRNFDLMRNQLRHFARNAFQHHAACAAAFQRESVMHELLNCRQRLSLHFVATHGVYRLRRQSDVPDHGDFRVYQPLHQWRALLAALDLDGLSARLYKACSVANRFLAAHVVGRERHI